MSPAKSQKKDLFLYSYYPEEIRFLSEKFSIPFLTESRKAKPQTIICFGGDGTFLSAERDFPGIPKLILRRSMTGHTDFKAVELLLKKFLEKDFSLIEFSKIAFSFGSLEAIATCDIILRNSHPNQALRFKVEKGPTGGFPQGDIIGDGMVVATPIGASAYYYTITRQTFSQGFGVAFNNPIVEMPSVHLEKEFSFYVEITRETGILCLDNLPCFWSLRAGEGFLVHNQVPQKTRLWDVRPYEEISKEDVRKRVNF